MEYFYMGFPGPNNCRHFDKIRSFDVSGNDGIQGVENVIPS